MGNVNHLSYFSLQEPQAMPAVQVALQRPLWVSRPEVPIGFPSSFTIVHDGVCMPIPVGAVLAPVPAGTYISPAHPIPVTVVYAIPTEPLPPQYPLPTRFVYRAEFDSGVCHPQGASAPSVPAAHQVCIECRM